MAAAWLLPCAIVPSTTIPVPIASSRNASSFALSCSLLLPEVSITRKKGACRGGGAKTDAFHKLRPDARARISN